MPMLTLIRQVLTPQQCVDISAQLDAASWEDTKGQAHGSRSILKTNQQLAADDSLGKEIGKTIIQSMLRNPEVQAFAMPRSIRHPTLCRYEQGAEYKEHLDFPLMLGGTPTRVDLSATIFLTDAADYQGGELCMLDGPVPQEIKGAAGDVVIYSSGACHRVNPVVIGSRRVAVTWIQSMVRNADQRGLLYDLNSAILELESTGHHDETLQRLRTVQHNMLRMWAEL